MKPRSRVLLFLLAVTVVTGAAQWDDVLTDLLDKAIGISWSKNLVIFLKNNTQGLIVFILLGIFLELAGVNQSDGKHRQEMLALHMLLQKTLSMGPGRALLSQGLADVYGEEAARQFEYNLFRECNIIRGMIINMRITNTTTSDFLIKVDLTYSTDAAEFYVAVTDDPLYAEAVLSTGIISEAFVCQTATSAIPASIQRIITDEASGSKSIINLEFAELSEGRKASLLKKSLSQFDLSKVRIFRPAKKFSMQASSGRGCLYRVSHQAVQPHALPYTFWLSDRVMHISSIEVDLTDLGEEIYSKAKLHRFLAASQWSSEISLARGSCVLPLDTWLVAGQGVVVVWSGERSSSMEAIDASA